MAQSTTNTDQRRDVDYCRISYDKVGAGDGVDSQHGDNVEFAEEQGRSITASYVDNDLSAYSGVARPQYERLREDIANGAVASVTFWHANRLHRELEEALSFLKLAREHDVRLFSVSKGGEYALNRTAGRQDLIRDTLDAQGESEQRGERVQLARKRQARTGTYGGGVRPFGWGVDTGRVRSVCLNPKAPPMERRYEDRPVLDMSQHNPTEAAEVRRWADDLLAGVSMAQILRDLARREVPTVSQTDGRQVRKDGKAVKHQGWNARTVSQVLTHPRTSGHSVYRGQILARDVYAPILSEDQRQALITLFADPARRTQAGTTPKWLGSLIYRCGVCDNDTTQTVRRNVSGTPVYRCRVSGHCQWPALPVDDYITGLVLRRLSGNDVADLIPHRHEIDVMGLRDELVTLNARKLDAAQRFAAGSIDGPMMETITATVEQRISAIRAELATATAQSPLTEFLTSDDVRATWEAQPTGRQREILRLLPFTVTLSPLGRGHGFNPDRIQITPTEPKVA